MKLAGKRQRDIHIAAIVFLIPVILFLIVFIFYPIVDTFITTEFEGGRHARRVGKIEDCGCGC